MIKQVVTIYDDPDKILDHPCEKVNDPTATEILNIQKDLYDTVTSNRGLGMAANQIGISKSIIIVQSNPYSFITIINPRIESAFNLGVSKNEGCFSIPDRKFNVKRYKRVTVTGYDVHGNSIELAPKSKRMCFALQHEIDHVNGITLLTHPKSKNI